MNLSQLKNIGPKSGEWLTSVGITTAEQLELIGSVNAYQMVKAAYPMEVSLNLLYAFEATLLNLDWKELPEDIKDKLKAQLVE